MDRDIRRAGWLGAKPKVYVYDSHENAAARDRLVTAGKVAPDATPEPAVEAFRAARPVLDGKGGG